jgi:iron complex transport system substrate-binding protein
MGFFILQIRQKTIKKYFAAVSLLLCIFAVSTCRKVEDEQPKVVELKREIIDDLGRKVELPMTVTRAVSLAPNLTEITFAVGAGENLVGVTSFCNYPEEAAKIQKVGDTLNPNIENIIALKPQVVLVSTASQIETFTKTLETQGISVFVTNPDSLESIYESIKKIGEIFGTKGKAVKLVENLEERIELVRLYYGSKPKLRVFVQIDKNSLYTIGKDSYMTDLIEQAGGISVTEGVATAYPKISKETALALQPEVIILSESSDNQEPNEVFANSPAVKNGRVYKIDADILSRPGPRVVDAMEQIAKKLHPEVKKVI